MKKRIAMILAFAMIFACLIAITAFADDAIEVKYYEWQMNGQELNTGSKSPKEIAQPNADGSYTLREKPFSGSGTVNINGDTVQKVFYGWYTEEGDIYAPGATVNFTRDTILYQAWGVEVINEAQLMAVTRNHSGLIARLTRDMVLTENLTTIWGIALVDLNGYNIEFALSSNSDFIGGQGTGMIFLGTGKITCKDENTQRGFFYTRERWGDGQQKLWIGKNVTIDTNKRPLTRIETINTQHLPDIRIYGTVKTPVLINITGNQHFPYIRIYESANITITGDKVFSGNTDLTDKGILTVYGGIFVIENPEATIFTENIINSYDISVLGGAFSVSDSQRKALEKYVPEGYSVQNVTIADKSYVVVAEVKESGHTHSYTLEGSQEASCLTPEIEIYICTCGDTLTLRTDEPKGHEAELVSDEPATPTALGKKLYVCKNCDYSYEIAYAYDPSDNIVSVVIGGNVYDVKIGEIFQISNAVVDGVSGASLVGLKDYDEFTAQDISEISIPSGIMFMDFNADYASLVTINILDGADITVKSFAKLSALETINIGASTVTFQKSCSNSVIKNLYSNKEGAYVTYEPYAFSKIKSLQNVTFSTNSDYILGAEAFGDCTGIKEIILPDYCRPVFKGSAFWQNNIEYIYVGRGITSLDNDPFNRNYKLKRAVLMDVNQFPNGWTFCWSYDWASDNDPTTGPAEIYIHSSELTIANDAFYQSHGVTVYTNAPITHNSAFSGCQSLTVDGITYPAYTIVYGIPHKYIEASIDPTCTEPGVKGYIADCPCGAKLDGTVSTQVFVGQKTNSNNYSTVVYTSEIVPATGHKEGTIIGVEYKNGYMSLGTKTCLCEVCSVEYIEETPSAGAMFEFLGYSTKENGGHKIVIGFSVNREAIKQFEELTLNTMEYGVVVALADKLNGNAPLDNAVASSSVIKAPVSKDYVCFEFIVSGFTDEMLDLEVVMAAYVSYNGKTVYLQGEQTDKPASVSINSLN